MAILGRLDSVIKDFNGLSASFFAYSRVQDRNNIQREREQQQHDNGSEENRAGLIDIG